ncbi:DUF5011 domain-containing protein, partial [bacterium]|nr:DUF5011 domain-containing protein [bacterium]
VDGSYPTLKPPAAPNNPPTVLALSASSIAENQAIGTVVGVFSTTDVDTGDTHTYTLVSDSGGTDNGNFVITGSSLETTASFDYETQSGQMIRVETADGNGGTLEQTFTISITDDTSDNPQVVSYGWEDTGVHLGKSGNLKSAVNVGAENGVTPHEGTKMLRLTGDSVSGNAPEAYLMWITGLTDGDQVTVSYWVHGLSDNVNNSSGRIWGGYTSTSQISSQSDDSASGNSTYAGGNGAWEQLSYTWTVAAGKVALNIKARVYADSATTETIYIDDMQVTVSKSSATINLPQSDTTVPVITLNGDASMTLQDGVSFADPGATADDSHEGDISANIAVTGDTVNVSTAGTYTLKYNVSDTAGNQAVEVVRTVVVTAPANDLHANRVAITSGATVATVNNTSAGGEADEPNSFGKDSAQVHSVWWKWTAATDGKVRISTEGSDFDTVLAVYSGTNAGDISTLNLITLPDGKPGKNNDTPWLHNANSMVEFDAVSGTEYAILVDGYGQEKGTIHLKVTDQDFPPLLRADGITVGIGGERSIGSSVEANDVESGPELL